MVFKNSIGFFVVLMLLFSCNNGTEQSKMEQGQFTTIEVQEVYDMGEVAKGTLIHADVKIKNTGEYPLYIANIQASCSCTVSDYEEEPIAPGKTTIVKATVDTDKTGSGIINKPITITANTKPSGTKVIIRAKVIN